MQALNTLDVLLYFHAECQYPAANSAAFFESRLFIFFPFRIFMLQTNGADKAPHLNLAR